MECLSCGSALVLEEIAVEYRSSPILEGGRIDFDHGEERHG